MSELTLTVLRLGLLAGLWFFVFALSQVLRRDLYGTRVSRRAKKRAAPVESRPQERHRTHEPQRVVVTDGSLRGTSLNLRDAGVLVGRNPECALVLDDDFASGRHCRIYRDEEGWKVEDLGSTNGTFLGDHRLTGPAPVGVGSQLRIGRTVLELRR